MIDNVFGSCELFMNISYKNVNPLFTDLQAVVAVAMLVRRFDFQMALGAPPVSDLYRLFSLLG